MESKSFVFYRSIFDAIEKIPDLKTQAQAFKAIANYGLNGVEPEKDVNPFVSIIFAQARSVLDSARRRYNACVENGSQGGAPRENQNARKTTEKQPNKQPENNPKTTKQTTKKQPKNNLNENVNDNVNYHDKEREKEEEKEREFFLLSLKNKFPNLKIETSQKDFSKFELEKIIKAIEKSEWLQNASIDFIFKNYDKVLAGNYDSFKKQKKSEIKNREYSEEFLNNLFDDLKTVEI